jgi:predicted NAD-dependent protein-ADP-ribosyltransferase YbiA (DUF1768 family)
VLLLQKIWPVDRQAGLRAVLVDLLELAQEEEDRLAAADKTLVEDHRANTTMGTGLKVHLVTKRLKDPTETRTWGVRTLEEVVLEVRRREEWRILKACPSMEDEHLRPSLTEACSAKACASQVWSSVS